MSGYNNNGGNNYPRKPRPVTILNERKLALTAAPIEKGAKPPSLVVDAYRSNPQITVFPNHDNGSGVVRIQAKLDALSFYMFAEAIRDLARPDAPPGTHTVPCSEPIPKEERQQGGPRNRKTADLRIGKTEEGMLWISVIDATNKDAPRIRFFMKPTYYHGLASKPEQPESFGSRIFALGWINFFTGLLPAVMHATHWKPEGREQQSGGNGGSYGNKGGGYGNNNGYKNNNSGGGSSGASAGGAGSGFDDGDFDDD